MLSKYTLCSMRRNVAHEHASNTLAFWCEASSWYMTLMLNLYAAFLSLSSVSAFNLL